MADRLRQIWSGFEGATTRPLTGRAVGNLMVPSRQDYVVHDEDFLSEEYRAPADAAFSALRAQLSAAEKKASKRVRDGETMNPFEAPEVSETAFNGDSDAARDLIKGLKATEARVRRSDYDYAANLAAGGKKRMFAKNDKAKPAKAPKAPKLEFKRKKFLGLF
jgi:hypothetical protein